jgi:predicted DNA-binding transcriptional regulator YafY
MTKAENKAARLSQIESLLLDHPEGLTQAQVARRLGVHRSTILRNLADLTAPVYEEEGRYFIDRESYLVNLRLTLNEALSIHLGARLMATRMDRENPHAASALRKLGIGMQNLAPQISRFIRGSADLFDSEAKRRDAVYLRALEKLTEAWAKSRKVILRYQGLDSQAGKEYVFSTYFIEVGAVGQAIYAIGRIDLEGQMRTFRLERISSVEMTEQYFTLPDDFDPEELFGQAWGIWFTGLEPVEIVLRFSQRVAQRVRETRWHRTEQVETQQDGRLLWRARIAEPQEMMPWIRGWGPEVEVLQPVKMRDEIASQAIEMARLYE